MTPSEKAIELVHKFLRCKDYSDSYYVIPIQEDATRCALIAVEMVILNCYEEEEYYWQKVKQEINKL